MKFDFDEDKLIVADATIFVVLLITYIFLIFN